jgi:general secretion pathway protein H
MKREKGFTLLELIIVMLLISIIAAIATVSFVNTLPAGKFYAAVREIVATIKHAKTLAQITGENQAVEIDLDAKRYGIEGRGERGLPPDTDIEVVDALAGEVRQGKYYLVFYAGGGFEGGTVILKNKKKSISISIDPIVGAVAIK